MAASSMGGSMIAQNSWMMEWIRLQNLMRDSVCINAYLILLPIALRLRLPSFDCLRLNQRSLRYPKGTMSARNDQFISNTCDGFDLYIAGFKLPAQVRYVNIYSAGLPIEVEAPGFL